MVASFNKTFALLGGYGTVIEFIKNVIPLEKNIAQFYSWWIIAAAFLISVFIHKPKRIYSFKVKNNDVKLKLKVETCFKKKIMKNKVI